MKAKSLSLALLLMAGVASSAFAQDREPPTGRGNLFPRAAPEAAQAPQAPQARPAPEARSAPEGRTPRSWPVRERDRAGPGPRELPSAEGARRDWDRGDAGRRDRDGRPHRDHNEDGRRDWDRGDRDRIDRDRGDRRWGDRNRHGEDRRWRDADRRDRDWDRGRRVRPDRPMVWQRGRYPPIYYSPHRYHGHVWRPPSGFYVRSWRFGEYLPSGWYGHNYRLTDWWAYDLPEPPYGYEWVRVGADVLLVDIYTGRIVQVVRLLFW